MVISRNADMVYEAFKAPSATCGVSRLRCILMIAAMQQLLELRRLFRGRSIATLIIFMILIDIALALAPGAIDAFHPQLEIAIRRSLAAPLEERFERAALTDNERAEVAGIIVLGGHELRFAEAAVLADRWAGAKLVISGASAVELRSLGPQMLGSGRIVREDRAGSTYENALYTAALVPPRPCEVWLLVTSAHHMPRALATFRRQGFNIEPWPVRESRADSPLSLAAVLHEWLALGAYRIMGRTDAFFPGPELADTRANGARGCSAGAAG